MQIIREKICTVAVRSFTEGCPFPQTSRLWRVVIILLREFHDLLPLESEILVSFLPRILEDERLAWERALALETAREVFADSELMFELYAICDGRPNKQGGAEGRLEGPRVFQDLLLAVSGQMLHEAMQAADEVSESSLDYRAADLKVSLLSQFDKAQPPPVPRHYVLHLSFDCLSSWITGMLLTPKPDDKQDQDRKEQLPARELLERCWPPVLKALCAPLGLGERLQSEWQRLLFASLTDFGRLSAAYALAPSLRLLLEALLDLAPQLHLPAWEASLRIALFDPEHIGAAQSWPSLVRVLHSVDIYTGMKARRISYSTAATTPVPLSALESPVRKQQQGTSQAGSSQVELDRLGSLSDLARELVEVSSLSMSDPCFTAFLTALGEQAVSSAKTDLFLAQRLKQVALKNVLRLLAVDSASWPILEGHLLALLTINDGQVRAQATDSLSLLCQAYFAAVEPEAFAQTTQLQERIPDLLLKLIEGNPGAQQLALENLGRMVQSLGPHLAPSAWRLVFRLVDQTAESAAATLDMALLRAAFNALRLVSGDFLSCLDEAGLRHLLEILGHRFISQTADINISLTAVGLLWDVSDFLRLQTSKSVSSSSFDIWLSGLALLVETAVEARPELRNSSAQTLMRSVELFALSLSKEQWAALFDQVLLPLCREVQSKSSLADLSRSGLVTASATLLPTHHSRDSQSKQWDETLVLTIQGLVRIHSEFIPILSALPSYASCWEALMALIEASCRPEKSCEVVGVAIACLRHLISSGDGKRCPESTWKSTWSTWRRISLSMPTSHSFTQESLDTYASCFQGLLSGARVGDTDWYRDSLAALDAALRCASPNDLVKDRDQVSTLQQTILLQVQQVDYPVWGLECGHVLLRVLSDWSALAPELRNLEMTRSSSVRRPRQQKPSKPTLTLPQPSQTGPTYIALTLRILAMLEGLFSPWARDPALYSSGAYLTILRIAGRLMILKYRAASPLAGDATWKHASRTVESLFRATPKSMLDVSCWACIVEVLEKGLEASRRMVPAGLAVEQLTEDEDFDMDHVAFIREHVLPQMGGAPEACVSSLLRALEHSSHLYYRRKSASPRLAVLEEDGADGDDGASCAAASRTETPLRPPPTISASIPSQIPDHLQLVPVIKERFAMSCLQTLFDLCAATAPLPLSRQVVRLALRILLDRVQRVIESYVEDRSLQGSMPFPRIRQDEMLFILSAVTAMRIAPGLAVEALYKQDVVTVASCVSDAVTDGVEAKMATLHVSDGRDHGHGIEASFHEVPPSFDQRRALMSTDIGHIFYLYPTLLSAMRLPDDDISELVHSAFLAMGHASGLIPL